MNKYSEEFLDECMEHVVKADEIKGNQELWKELVPYMKERGERVASIADEKPSSLDELWKKGKKEASEKEMNEKSERLAKEKEPKLGSKA